MGPLKVARAAGRAAGFAAWTLGVVEGHRALTHVDDDLLLPEGKQVFIDAWSRGVFPIFGVDLHVTRGSRPIDPGPFLVISNHRSPLDILVLVNLVGGVILSHDGVQKIPVVRRAAIATDTIFVDRSAPKSGAAAIRAMRRMLRAGRNVILFPEGTTFRGDEVRPFKRGAFIAGRNLDAQVLPLGVAYRPGDEFVDESFGQHLLRMASRRRTPIWATIGEPMPVPKTAADEEAVRLVVEGLVAESAAARDAQLTREGSR